MPLALVIVLVAIAGGTIASYAWDDDAPVATRLGYGAATGLAALGIVGFAVTQLAGLTAGTLGAAVIVASPLLALRGTAQRRRIASDLRQVGAELTAAVRQPSHARLGPVAFSAGIVGLLWLVFDRVLFVRDGAVYTGYANNLGDLPFHLQVTASFAYGNNFPPEDPTYAGTGFAYPYISDFIAAMLVHVGATMRQAFLVQNLALGLSLVAILHRFTIVLTRDRLAAFIAPLVVLFSGGLGWVLVIDEARRGERGIVAALAGLTHDVTITSDGPYRWGNAITTLLVTQRSLLSGLPIALIVFILLWKLLHADPPPRPRLPATGSDALDLARANRIPIAAGVLTGVLPLIHAHSFVVVMGTAFLLGLLFRQWRDGRWVGWAVYVVVALVLALPQVWWSTHDSIANAGTFFGIELGWDRRDENVAWFWFLNTGLFIPLAILGGVWALRSGPRGRSAVLFAAAFLAWFIVPNVVKLAPWVWDNIKVLFYWFVGLAPLVAFAVARLLRGGLTLRLAGAAALVALILAGSIDVWRVASGRTEYQEFDPDGVAIADVIRQRTPPRALVLHAPTWNPPVFLTGRRSLLGYTGYIWAHGLEYAGREEDIKRIYAGAAGADELLARYGIDYVVVSPLERGYMPVNDAWFERFPTIAEVGAYRLYEVRPG